MLVELITRWEPVDEYKEWVLEKAHVADLPGCTKPDAERIRARRTHYTIYAPDGMQRAEAILHLEYVIDGMHMWAADLFGRSRAPTHFMDLESARDYATLRIDGGGRKTVRLYVGTDRWRFHKDCGRLIGVVIQRNAL